MARGVGWSEGRRGEKKEKEKNSQVKVVFKYKISICQINYVLLQIKVTSMSHKLLKN